VKSKRYGQILECDRRPCNPGETGQRQRAAAADGDEEATKPQSGAMTADEDISFDVKAGRGGRAGRAERGPEAKRR